MKKTAIFALLACFLMAGCEDQAALKDIEAQVRAEVFRESAGLASLQAIYIIDYVSLKQNWVRSDDAYIKKDKVEIDYGYQIDDNAIRVVREGARKVLQVRLKKGTTLATNRVELGVETTHKGYIPKDSSGKNIDVDEEINRQLEEAKAQYEGQHLKTAAENIKNFFKVIAAKYGLELDFQVES